MSNLDAPGGTDASVASMAAAVSQATTGAGTPDSVSVKRPAKEVVRTLLVAMGFILAGIGAVIWLAAASGWFPATERVALMRLSILKWIGLSLCLDQAIIIFAFASPFVGRVEAEAGNNKVVLAGRD